MSLLPKETVRYVNQFGGFCRDCADNMGICPISQLPCETREAAIKWVVEAINYGAEHGFMKVSTHPRPERGIP